MKTILKVSAVLAIASGILMVLGGGYGIKFTYDNIKKENIVTPKDASIPETAVLGPFTLMSQAEIIREHTLKTTGGKTYAEMERENPTREMWVTATTLTTALNLGIIAYLFSGLFLLFGLISIWTGFVYMNLVKKFSTE